MSSNSDFTSVSTPNQAHTSILNPYSMSKPYQSKLKPNLPRSRVKPLGFSLVFSLQILVEKCGLCVKWREDREFEGDGGSVDKFSDFGDLWERFSWLNLFYGTKSKLSHSLAVIKVWFILPKHDFACLLTNFQNFELKISNIYI